MSDPKLDPLPPEISKLLSSATRPVVPPGFQSKVLGRIQHSLAAAPAVGMLSKMGTLGLPASVAALVVGVAAGAMWQRPTAPPPAPPTPTVAPPSLNPVPEAKLVDPERPPAQSSAMPPRRAIPVIPRRVERDVELADERALIEVARTALGQRDTARALEAIEQHVQRFDHGQLIEEREALWVQVLMNQAKTEQALAKADAFRVRFPDSMLLPAVEAALQPPQ